MITMENIIVSISGERRGQPIIVHASISMTAIDTVTNPHNANTPTIKPALASFHVGLSRSLEERNHLRPVMKESKAATGVIQYRKMNLALENTGHIAMNAKTILVMD
jgi:hypothetical protein